MKDVLDIRIRASWLCFNLKVVVTVVVERLRLRELLELQEHFWVPVLALFSCRCGRLMTRLLLCL